MTTPATAAAAGASGAPAAAQTIASAQQSLSGDQTMFLKLLTAQLKNQDPLSPMDTNQFTQQLVVMTGVQQQLLTNQLLQQMLANQGGVGSAVDMVGKQVTAQTASATLQAGKADWTYSLDSDAANVSLQVLDSTGKPVWQSAPGSLSSGEHTVSWNGKGVDGAQRSDGGAYSLQVVAKDSSGATVGSHVFRTGLVSSVVQENGQVLVEVGGVKVPLSAVTAVGAAA